MTQYSGGPRDSINVNDLGYFLDGWADLVEGMSDKADDIHANVLGQLEDRQMPDIQTSVKQGYVNYMGSERRDYTVTTTSPGATTLIYIGKHGKDLYTSWRTFIHLVLNRQVLLIALGICAALGLFTGGINRSNNFFGGPSSTSFSLFGWVGATIGFAILAAVILGVAGRVMKGSFWAYFFIEPSYFDADDITAMSLSAHKSLLRALDSVGIELSKLRIKQDFKGGRRDVTL